MDLWSKEKTRKTGGDDGMMEEKSWRASSFEPGIEGEEKKKKKDSTFLKKRERERRIYLLFMIYFLSLFYYYFPVFYFVNLIILYNGITPSPFPSILPLRL